MRVTMMRDKSGELPSTDTLLKLERELKRRFDRAGFITGITFGDTRSSMKIGLHMRSFRIDVAKLGHNADHSQSGRMCKVGYKRTDVPTWSQRVEFNNIINNAFDRFGLSARIVSGEYEVRSRMGRINIWSCTNGRALEIQKVQS